MKVGRVLELVAEYTSHAAWVDEELAVILRDAVLVSVTAYENITVGLSLHCNESLHVTSRNNLVSVDDPYLNALQL